MEPNDLSQREARVDELIQRGDSTDAIRLLLELIAAYAKRGAFAKAEALRERLYDIDSMALTEIVEASELIESAQSQAIDPNKLSAFGALIHLLSADELNVFYYGLEDRRLAAGEVLCKQGQLLEQLVLVRGGTVQLLFRSGDKTIEIASLSAGDLAGQDSVFNSTFSTTEIRAQTPSALSVLSKAVVEGWQQEQPALYTKLQQFCRKRQAAIATRPQRQISRRRHPRLSLEGALQFQLIDRQGQRIGKTMRGALVNIAEGGLAFMIKSSTPRGANLLLGRGLWARFALSAGRHQGRALEVSGQVVGVINALFNDYIVHLAFHKPLHPELLEGLTPETFKPELA